MSKVIYASNKGVVGDGMRITRVSNGGAKFEVMVDEKTERFSEVIVVADDTQPGGGDTQPGGGDTQPGGGDTQPGGGDTQPGGGDTGGGVPTPPVIGQTVAINETDLMAKANALKGTGKDYVLGIKDGHFGPVAFSGLDLGGGAKLTIVAENRREAIFERVTLLSGSRNIRTQGICVCPRGIPTLNANGKTYGFTADASTSGIDVRDGVFRGSLDSGNHPWWDQATWGTYALGAVFLQGPDSSVANSYAEGVDFGFNVTGDRSILSNLYVYGASGDAFRLGGDDMTVLDVLGTDLVYRRNGNHPDLAQAFKRLTNGTTRGLKNLTVNRLAGIEWTVRYDNPLRVAVDAANDAMKTPGIMQGIGFHQGGASGMSLVDIYIRTATRNGIKIAGVNNLYGRRWNVLNGDYKVRGDQFPATGQPGANYDARYPQVDIGRSGIFDVDDVMAEHLGFGTPLPISNYRRPTSPADYAARPAWVDAIKAVAN